MCLEKLEFDQYMKEGWDTETVHKLATQLICQWSTSEKTSLKISCLVKIYECQVKLDFAQT